MFSHPEIISRLHPLLPLEREFNLASTAYDGKISSGIKSKKGGIMKMATIKRLLLSGSLLLMLAGCATLDVTPKKALSPATDKQSVTIGIQASGDRLVETLNAADGALVKSASGTLFDRVIILPKESKYQLPQEVKAAHAVDYILSIGIGDISVSGDLNPLWFASLPLLFFKVYAPIITFQPGISLDMTLRDATSGAVLMQKQVMEVSSDHYAPSDPGAKVRQLISLTINNALVAIMRDAQQSIAAARKGK